MRFTPDTFSYIRRVAFCDTDSMGVVHHANYVRYFEEARVEWLRVRGLNQHHYPLADMCLAVLESECRHLAPARFEEELKIYMQARGERLKIHLQYAIVRATDESQVVTLGRTVLVPLSSTLKPLRPPRELTAQLEKEPWTETWL
ncbi:MAG: acyl-CoA thioesterase [Bdellovibrionales bacterium]